jgi:2-polyprenyl-3-methyl-5-hydroxy-6-metoxy-1,4-benzoquinol methylase
MDDHHYLIRGGIEGRERLRVLARVMRPTTLPLLERAGVTAGMRCLDVGCGGGDVTFDLASLVGITGSAVGVDLDATKIHLARGDAEQAEVANVEFRVADLADGLGEAEYDVVYARFVLTHLPDPAAGLASMVAALKPGGRLAVEDIDYRGSFCEPEQASFERYEQIYTQAAFANGGDPHIATRLPLMVVDAGLHHVTATVIQPAGLEGEVKVLPPLTLENIKATAVLHGVADAAEIDRLVDDLYTIARDPRTFVGNPRMVQVWGEKA